MVVCISVKKGSVYVPLKNYGFGFWVKIGRISDSDCQPY